MSKEIALVLGPHDEPEWMREAKNVEAAEPVQRRLNDIACDLFARHPSKNIAIVVEDYSGLRKTSEVIQGYVASGYPPSLAISLPTSTPFMPPRSELNQLVRAYAAMSADFSADDDFRPEILRTLDVLHEQYEQRLTLVVEGHERSVHAWIMSYMEKVKDLVAEEQRAISIYDFVTAIRAFRESVLLSAYVDEMREVSVMEQLHNVLRGSDVAGAVVNFGAAHSTMGHILRTQGYDIRLAFEYENGKKGMLFEPYTVAVRQIRMHGEESMSNYEWMLLAMGDFYWEVFSKRHNPYKTMCEFFPDEGSIMAMMPHLQDALRKRRSSEGPDRSGPGLV